MTFMQNNLMPRNIKRTRFFDCDQVDTAQQIQTELLTIVDMSRLQEMASFQNKKFLLRAVVKLILVFFTDER